MMTKIKRREEKKKEKEIGIGYVVGYLSIGWLSACPSIGLLAIYPTVHSAAHRRCFFINILSTLARAGGFE